MPQRTPWRSGARPPRGSARRAPPRRPAPARPCPASTGGRESPPPAPSCSSSKPSLSQSIEPRPHRIGAKGVELARSGATVTVPLFHTRHVELLPVRIKRHRKGNLRVLREAVLDLIPRGRTERLMTCIPALIRGVRHDEHRRTSVTSKVGKTVHRIHLALVLVAGPLNLLQVVHHDDLGVSTPQLHVGIDLVPQLVPGDRCP